MNKKKQKAAVTNSRLFMSMFVGGGPVSVGD